MVEVTVWIAGVQTGGPFRCSTLEFIEGIFWGLTNVAKCGEVEIRVVYNEAK